jgi:hypothetical protein
MDNETDIKADISPVRDGGETTSQMEPLLIPEGSRHRGVLTDLAVELAQRAAGFRRSLPGSLLVSLANLVRAMNCYFKNRQAMSLYFCERSPVESSLPRRMGAGHVVILLGTLARTISSSAIEIVFFLAVPRPSAPRAIDAGGLLVRPRRFRRAHGLWRFGWRRRRERRATWPCEDAQK